MASTTCACSLTATCPSSPSSPEHECERKVNIPESWLRTFCNPSISGGELADKLTMAGLEVEAYAPASAQFSGVVVGEIVSVEKHPNADKLTVCTVSDGAKQHRVVCGAPNARAGM